MTANISHRADLRVGTDYRHLTSDEDYTAFVRLHGITDGTGYDTPAVLLQIDATPAEVTR